MPRVRPDVEARRRAVLDRPWSWLHQVHGSVVVAVDRPGGGAGATGDALVSSDRGAALCVLTADCAPVAFASPEGVVGVAHAGWRGLAAGVIGATVDSMRARGATDVVAALGPCIHAECYEFSAGDLEALASSLGPSVRGVTSGGRPALDLPAAVRTAVDRAGATLEHDARACTACGNGYYSHRARTDLARQATVVWLP